MFVIRYEYPGTVNGVPVGTVYVVECHWIEPGVFSYTRDPVEATQYATVADAERAMIRDDGRPRHWPQAKVLTLRMARAKATRGKDG